MKGSDRILWVDEPSFVDREEVHPPVAHIGKRPDRPKPWRVRYRDPKGRERSRSFSRKVDAQRFMATVQADLIRGDWTDPRLSKTILAEWSQRWLRTKAHLKPKTLAGYRSNLRAHVLPAFGGYQLCHIDRMAVEEWLADPQTSGLGPSGVRQARQVLGAMLTLAVDAGYRSTNSVDGTSIPRLPEAQMLFLDADQVDLLADTIRQPYGTLVYVLAYGGLRWGEAAALRRKRCDLSRSRIEVAESLADVGGHLHFGPTKTYRRRIAHIPGFLHNLLAEHLAHNVPDEPEALVFTAPGGTPLRNSNFRRQIWYPAVEKAGLPEGLRIHDLRHTCASLLAAARATPKAVQAHLRHSSITVTMDRYTTSSPPTSTPSSPVTRYITLAEYFWLAEQVTGVDATTLIHRSRVDLADSTLHAPPAGFGTSTSTPTCQTQEVERHLAIRRSPLCPLRFRRWW